ncbi:MULTISPECIES: hypothetical protein [Aminobacterium]|nr:MULTISPECIES: hypothetical protein [Aminobacterium]MDD2379237.1 hypothetical protein [Aminobacterium colombiense]MDD3767808.1 hypothetical protein [Aminobacterium colombiense]MDD4585948.1 hypothetical protein [Aminobacterium colombiense]
MLLAGVVAGFLNVAAKGGSSSMLMLPFWVFLGMSLANAGRDRVLNPREAIHFASAVKMTYDVLQYDIKSIKKSWAVLLEELPSSSSLLRVEKFLKL